MSCLVVLVVFLTAGCHLGDSALHLNSYFSDHMVLQRGPQQAVLWGTSDNNGDTVTAQVKGQGANGAQVSVKVSQGKWKLKLPAQTAKGPFTIDVSSGHGHASLNDVLYGDVWLCSGQSNMGYSMQHVMNADQEKAKALQFPDVRFARASQVETNTPLDSIKWYIPWTGPRKENIGESFAVCWLFGEYLHQKLNRPIGLIQSAWGGTPIQAWSPPQVMSACSRNGKRGPRDNSHLWNAMIHPFISSTIYGAIWYQGEQNAWQSDQYACQVQHMLSQWRGQFHQQSLQQTASDFPFGYVQLAPTEDKDDVGQFPGERWAQTGNYGYSPNPALPRTFMAVAMDLPDFSSPMGALHPRTKQDVAQRLVLGALNVAYGQSSVRFQGPFPTALWRERATLHVQYDGNNAHLTIKNNHGFEVCCSSHSQTHCNEHTDQWLAAPISSHMASQVVLDTSGCGQRHVVGVRYAWRTTPCHFKQCAVYDSRSGLPAAIYISHDLTVSKEPEVIG